MLDPKAFGFRQDPEVWCEQLGIPSIPALKAASGQGFLRASQCKRGVLEIRVPFRVLEN